MLPVLYGGDLGIAKVYVLVLAACFPDGTCDYQEYQPQPFHHCIAQLNREVKLLLKVRPDARIDYSSCDPVVEDE